MAESTKLAAAAPERQDVGTLPHGYRLLPCVLITHEDDGKQASRWPRRKCTQHLHIRIGRHAWM